MSDDIRDQSALTTELQAVGETCVCLHTRMAARAVTRAYDAALAPLGLEATQFTLLAAIAVNPSRSVTETADRLALERTSLSRNLALLKRRGLIAVGEASGRSVSHAVTAEGEALIARALPLWQAVQTRLEASLGDGEGWVEARRRLRTIRREASAETP